MTEHNLTAHFVIRSRLSIAMQPAEFMAEIVLPTVLEFRNDRRSRRRAYLACIVTFQMNDHLKKAGEKRPEDALRAATDLSFDVVRGVCNGTKHVWTNDSHPIAFVIGDDQDRPPAICDDLECDASELEDGAGGRSIETDQGSVDLYDACAAVLRAYAEIYPQHFIRCDFSQL
ncbi:hypothetical protein MKK67_11605 [Methylobacterium sp. J-072]|uniref:hypothetical protein n=1 Tax=Methylobacterium sp. J-072 TaxID=2836651 RepID=UPI001FBB4305|nr:hypothetical protein [Methylobacterium sp. J-072]MCJ2093137.1 hypothetical protein [Methylobacterium sp. J-072]